MYHMMQFSLEVSLNAEVTGLRLLYRLLLLNMKMWVAKPKERGQFWTYYVFIVITESLADS